LVRMDDKNYFIMSHEISLWFAATRYAVGVARVEKYAIIVNKAL